ncbi:MAG: sulfotransferase [Xanthobacteraceae bacterium]
MITHTRADVLHIGYPKSASTFVGQFLKNHSEVTTDHNCLAELLLPHPTSDPCIIAEKPNPDKIHISRDESIAESVCVIGELRTWQRYLYVPNAWDRVKSDIVVDPFETAARLHKVHPSARVLMLIREQVDWLQSAYKFVISQLPANQRSFSDYCTTPSGIVFLKAGHFDQTIGAYVDIFGSQRVRVLRFEDIVTAPSRFAAELCAFVGISERSIPQSRANETHALMTKIQRLLPIVERLPRGVKDAVKPHAMRLLPGARASILSSRDARLLRSMYVASNQRTEKLIAQLPGSRR